MEKDQGVGSVTKGMEITPSESVDKKQFPIIPYSHGKGLIKLTTRCNTPSHPLGASGFGIRQAVSITTVEGRSRCMKCEHSNSNQIIHQRGFLSGFGWFWICSLVYFFQLYLLFFFLIIRYGLMTKC